MEPPAKALDKLQGENNSFLGYVAPTILVVRRLLIYFTNLKYCKPLSLTIIKSLETRFYYILDLSCPESKDFIIASVNHPKFKLSWVPLRYMSLCKTLFITECCIVINSETKSTDVAVEDSVNNNSDDDFFDNICKENDFNSTTDSESTKLRNSNLANLQDLSFLNSKNKDFNILNEFPAIKEVFFKYNTTIPSSAAVERLFSKAIQVLTPRRNRLSDDTFQMILCFKSKYDL